jgi:hypothetical protein
MLAVLCALCMWLVACGQVLDGKKMLTIMFFAT